MQEVKSVTSGGAGEYLTGSAHLMSMSLNVQYRVRDAYTYHYRVANPVHVIDDNIRKELRRHVAGWTLDEMLNVDRAKLQTPIGDVFAKRLPGGDSALLDANETVKAGLISVNPVGDSMSAFQEVSSSQDDRERIIVNAQRLWPYPGFPARTATQPTKSSRLGAKRNGEPLPPPPRSRRSTRLWAPPGKPRTSFPTCCGGNSWRCRSPPATALHRIRLPGSCLLGKEAPGSVPDQSLSTGIRHRNSPVQEGLLRPKHSGKHRPRSSRRAPANALDCCE